MQKLIEGMLLQNRMQISTHQTRAGKIDFPSAYKDILGVGHPEKEHIKIQTFYKHEEGNRIFFCSRAAGYGRMYTESQGTRLKEFFPVGGTVYGRVHSFQSYQV